MAKTLEQLEADIESLKAQVAEGAYARDYLEIWKLQSLYSHLYHIGRRSQIPALFAQHTPGVSLEMEDSGVYEGIESINRLWNGLFGDKLEAGQLAIHMTVNPVIEIAPDRTRAKGLWHSFGYCSLPIEGALKQFLSLGKYDMEYVKEDGQWKILKFGYRQTFMCPYERGWQEEPVAASIAGRPENVPDKPTTYYMPYSRYRINVFQPGPPEPFAK
jgi:SnoaL-like domain